MYKRNEQSFFKHIDFIILDSIVMQIAFAVSYMLRHGFSNPYASMEYRQMATIMAVLLICVSFMTEGYKNILHRGYLSELQQCAKIVTTLSLLLIAYLFVVQSSSSYSRSVVLMSWMIGLYFIYMEHIIWKSILVNELRKGTDRRQILLVADDAGLAEEVLRHIDEQGVRDFQIVRVAVLDNGTVPGQLQEVPVLQGMDEALAYVSDHVVDEVFIHTTSESKVPESFIEDCLNIGVVIHQNLKEELPYDVRQEVSRLGGYTVLTASINSAASRQLFFKRVLDIIGSLVGLLFTGIAFLFVAPIIKIQSPGPVIFKQKRVGKSGRQFEIYKFRSMYQDAEQRKKELERENEVQGLMFKMDNDPRITKVGAFLRKTSLDEFPQFLNVLKGDMSLVGTRPPTEDEFEQYDEHYRRRLSMTPGLTGMWQVSGRSEISDFDEVVRLDLQYIDNWSLTLDFKILLQTVIVVLGHRGAK